MTTIITASIAMMATRAITASPSKDKIEIEQDEKSTSVSTLEVITTKYQAFCDRIRKNPILLWIPLLFILLLLALAGSHKPLESEGKPPMTSVGNTTETTL